MKKMKKRVVIFGNQQVALDCAAWLLKRKDINLIAFVGCEKLKDKKYGYPSTRMFCNKNNIRYIDPERLDDTFFKLFKTLKPDLCLSIYYRNIFQSKYLAAPSLGFVNLHPSLLPKYRGSMPTLWALFNNEKEVGSTIHYIDKRIDTGDIIAQKKYTLPRNITGNRLHVNLMNIGFRLFKKTFPLVLKGKAPQEKQNDAEATYFSSFNQKLRLIDWYSPSDKIVSKIRALTKPYDGAVSHLLDKDIVFWNARKFRLSNRYLRGAGIIMRTYKNGTFVVSCIDGFFLVSDFIISETTRDFYSKYIYVGNKFI